MTQEVFSLGGEDYSVEYSYDKETQEVYIDSIWNLTGYFVDITQISYEDLIDKIKDLENGSD